MKRLREPAKLKVGQRWHWQSKSKPDKFNLILEVTEGLEKLGFEMKIVQILDDEGDREDVVGDTFFCLSKQYFRNIYFGRLTYLHGQDKPLDE